MKVHESMTSAIPVRDAGTLQDPPVSLQKPAATPLAATRAAVPPLLPEDHQLILNSDCEDLHKTLDSLYAACGSCRVFLSETNDMQRMWATGSAVKEGKHHSHDDILLLRIPARM